MIDTKKQETVKKGVTMQINFEDIKEYQTFKRIDEIAEGWSTDKKYYVETKDGQKLLLRIAGRKLEKQKRLEFDRLNAIYSDAFPMAKPLSFGICNGGESVYTLLTWVEGVPLNTQLKKMIPADQYSTGIMAGKMLRAIHAAPVVDKQIPTKEQRIAHKLNKIKMYETSYVRASNDSDVIDYVKNNIDKIYNTPPAYKHGDFHSGNLIYTPEGSIGLIDFNRIDCGDKYEDFRHIQLYDAGRSIPFATGVIDGYFDTKVPNEFWEVLAVYVAQTAMTQINWAERFGIDEVDAMQQIFHKAFRDYNGFKNTVPSWYEKI